jgi:hypothetical protein
MTNPNYRVDLLLVPSTQKDLTSIQTKINNWITTGTLVKYQKTVCPDGFLFEIVRTKEKE